MFSAPPRFLAAANSSGDRDECADALAAAAGAASSTGEAAGSAMEGVVGVGGGLEELDLSEFSPEVQHDLVSVEDHFHRLRKLMLRLVGKYGSGPGDDAIYDHLRCAHEDLQAKLVMAGTQPHVEESARFLPVSAVGSGDVPVVLDVHDDPAAPRAPDVPVVSDVPDASGDALVALAPEVSDVISLSSENTQFYPDDDDESNKPLMP